MEKAGREGFFDVAVSYLVAWLSGTTLTEKTWHNYQSNPERSFNVKDKLNIMTEWAAVQILSENSDAVSGANI